MPYKVEMICRAIRTVEGMVYRSRVMEMFDVFDSSSRTRCEATRYKES